MSDDPSAGAADSRFVYVADTVSQYVAQRLAEDAHQMAVIAVLFDRSPAAWLRDWQATMGDLSGIVEVIAVGAIQRSAAASTVSPQSGSRSPPGLTAVEPPADLKTLERAIQAYGDAWPAASTQRILWIESLTAAVQQTSLTAVSDLLYALQPHVAAIDAMAYFTPGPDADVDAERHRTALLAGEHTPASEANHPPAVSAALVEEVGRELAALRRAEPATYARLETHWQIAKTGLERTEQNYAKAHQIYRTLEEPELNVQTLGWTLNGLAALGVLDVWDGRTNGPNRYDLTSYDPARLTAVSIHLDVDTHLEPEP